MRRVMSSAALFGLMGIAASLVAVFVAASPAAACSCAGAPFDGANAAVMTQAGELAFIAQLASSVVDEDDALWNFDVEKVLVGNLGDEVTVRTSTDGAACGFEGMRIGESYAVLAYPGESHWESGLCSIDSPSAAVGFGDPRPPDPALNPPVDQEVALGDDAGDGDVAGEGLLLPVVGGVMLVTLCALALGLTLGRRQRKAPRRPRR